MPEDQQIKLYEVPLPVTVGGSYLSNTRKGVNSSGRIAGPPSITYPILRDLANAPATVTIEIDTKQNRFVGVIDHIEPARSTARSDTSNPERLVVRSPARSERLRPIDHRISLGDVIAFQVLKIEVTEFPIPAL